MKQWFLKICRSRFRNLKKSFRYLKFQILRNSNTSIDLHISRYMTYTNAFICTHTILARTPNLYAERSTRLPPKLVTPHKPATLSQFIQDHTTQRIASSLEQDNSLAKGTLVGAVLQLHIGCLKFVFLFANVCTAACQGVNAASSL